MMMHLAAAALGLGSQHVTIHIQEPFKRILGVPDLLTFSLIMPIGLPAVRRRKACAGRSPTWCIRKNSTCRNNMSNDRSIQYLYALRQKTVPVYSHSYAGRPPVPDTAKK